MLRGLPRGIFLLRDERGMRLTEQLALLIELQKTDSTAGRIQARKRDLPLQVEELEKEYSALCADADAEREQLEALRKHRREKDAQLQTGQETLKRTRERLFDVKTNKEYQSILKEIETLEAKNSRMEDEIISLLDELDHLETAVKTKEGELNVGRLRYEEQKAKLAEELNSLAEELTVCLRKSDEFKKKIPADVLRKYEQIKGIGRGMAVVSVWKEVCGGCHMSIPPQLYNELQKSTTLLTTCPNCNRIVYWENRNG
jgi:predicted  nucleic acid-binding Zn-ribbon protein